MTSNKTQKWEKLSVVGEKYRDLYSWEEEEALFREVHLRKNLLPGFMSTKGIRAMIKRFKVTGKLVQPGRGRNRITPVLVDGVKTAVRTVPDFRVCGQ
ncbi:hypothetical protein TNCV_4567971 [Trichonephila clavipes]|nr:hypothetical protein TNCV_4567971 [Trichonephila clavipes]